ncbi:MAG: SpoIIE family protein phosphatase [Bryobacteraceae bacterium]
MDSESARGTASPAFLTVRSPSGTETRVALEQMPFRIGRHADNELVLRDSRASRQHAQIVAEGGAYFLEDVGSNYGVFVNGERVQRSKLKSNDQIEFGFPDSYHMVFSLGEIPSRTKREKAAAPAAEIAGGANLGKLRAMLELARALQASLSTDEVLVALVDAALAVTGCERGFLLMRRGDELEIRIGRSKTGPLASTDLRVPASLLMRALKQRKEFLSMEFDPAAGGPERTVADLELRSVVCVPMVRVRTGSAQETAAFHPLDDTVGLLYMDSRLKSADLSSGGRELLTTLALEASTVLENARLLEEQWARQRMEHELAIARQIQESLLPRALPTSGWFRAAASSIPCNEVGGDFLDVRQIHRLCWIAISADVSGKGVGAALLASLLQGLFLAAPYTKLSIEEMMLRVNRFLNERTGGEQYVTIFYCTVEASGLMRWVNAGHPPPLVMRAGGQLDRLAANGVPVGMLGESTYTVEEGRLEAGDKIVMYSDGLTEARNAEREFYGLKRLCAVLNTQAAASCQGLHAAILSDLDEFTGRAPQSDDISLAVLEYRPE